MHRTVPQIQILCVHAATDVSNHRSITELTEPDIIMEGSTSCIPVSSSSHVEFPFCLINLLYACIVTNNEIVYILKTILDLFAFIEEDLSRRGRNALFPIQY